MKHRALLLGLVAALPAVAGEDGFTLGVNTGLMKVNNHSPLVVASFSNPTARTSSNVFAEYGDHTPIGLDLSFRSGDNAFSLNYFSSSKKKSSTFSILPPYSGSGISGYGVGNTDAKAEDSIIDVTWKHYVSVGNHGTFNTLMGLRSGDFKNTVYQRSYSPTNTNQWSQLEIANKTSAYGLLVGAGYSYPFNDSLSVGCDLTFGFLQGSDKSDFTNSSYNAAASFYNSEAKDQAYTQQDMALHLDWKVLAGLKLSWGYRYMDFGKVNKTNIIGVFYFDSPGGWGLSGFTFGASYTF